MNKLILTKHVTLWDLSPYEATLFLWRNSLTGKRFWTDETGLKYKFNELPEVYRVESVVRAA